MKINRRNIQKFYADSIEKIAARAVSVHWQTPTRADVVLTSSSSSSSSSLIAVCQWTGSALETSARHWPASRLLSLAMAFTSPAPVSSIIISSPPSSATFSDKSLWRSQTVPIITAINFLLTRGRLPGGATDFEDGLEGGRQQA
ncbi:hypothetical protein TYRP_002938, partial [Tyrophagus putrescentiae]